MARVPTIGLVIDGKVQIYKRKHGLENSDIVCDTPLPVHEWSHTDRQVTITETNEATTYPIEIYTDGSKDASTVRAGVAIYYHNKQLIKRCRHKLLNQVLSLVKRCTVKEVILAEINLISAKMESQHIIQTKYRYGQM